MSRAFLEGFYYKPRVDRELLAQHADGLLVLSGCLNSEVSRMLSAGDAVRARETAGWYQEVFGKDHYFMEVQAHGLEEQERVMVELHGKQIAETSNVLARVLPIGAGAERGEIRLVPR